MFLLAKTLSSAVDEERGDGVVEEIVLDVMATVVPAFEGDFVRVSFTWSTIVLTISGFPSGSSSLMTTGAAEVVPFPVEAVEDGVVASETLVA